DLRGETSPPSLVDWGGLEAPTKRQGVDKTAQARRLLYGVKGPAASVAAGGAGRGRRCPSGRPRPGRVWRRATPGRRAACRAYTATPKPTPSPASRSASSCAGGIAGGRNGLW